MIVLYVKGILQVPLRSLISELIEMEIILVRSDLPN